MRHRAQHTKDARRGYSKKQSRDLAELPHQVNNDFLEHQQRELARGVYQAIDTTGLGKFTFSFIDSRWDDLNAIVQHLDHVSEAEFRVLFGVLADLTAARDELRLARFLFDLEEINSVYRLVMRNRAVRRAKYLLEKVVEVWPER